MSTAAGAGAGAGADPAPGAGAGAGARAGRVVLVVEDEDSIRLTLRDYLRKKGHEVIVASDGVGAIKQILDNPVSLVVTDYRMDIFGGDYWIRFLREFCPRKKVIITSGFLQPEFPIPFPVVYKPYDYSELEGLIRRSLEET